MEVKLHYEKHRKNENKSRFDVYDYDDLCRFSRINCIRCNELTCYGVLIGAGDMIITYECKKCEIYHCICDECNCDKMNKFMNTEQYVKLLELQHHQIVEDDREVPENRNKYFITFDGKLRKVTYVTPTYCFDEKIFGEITGPVGGFESYWKCDCCDNTLELLDK